MISLVRVDDRLLHGQIICAWVPYVEANALIVASDEVASNGLVREIMGACACDELKVTVLKVDDAVLELRKNSGGDDRVILVFANLTDAMRFYEQGVKFKTLNIGNIHHAPGGRNISPSVIVDRQDEEIMERFVALGVVIDIRDVPAKEPILFPAPGAGEGKNCDCGKGGSIPFKGLNPLRGQHRD